MQQAERAQAAFASGNDAGAIEPIEAGLGALRILQANTRSLNVSAEARYEIDFRLRQKEFDYEAAEKPSLAR